MAASNNCVNLLSLLRNTQQMLFWSVRSGQLTGLRQLSVAIHRILDFPVPPPLPPSVADQQVCWLVSTATSFYPRLLSSMYYYNNRPIHYNIPLNAAFCPHSLR
jgi:hypothetical protein